MMVAEIIESMHMGSLCGATTQFFYSSSSKKMLLYLYKAHEQWLAPQVSLTRSFSQ